MLSYDDLCRLGRVFVEHSEWGNDPPDRRIHEWLKEEIAKAHPGKQQTAAAELTEQRKTILDDPANTLFGIPMTAVKRLINEKRAEEGDNWWVLERPHITEQRGVTSAKEFYQEHKEFWVIPVDPDNTDPTLVKVHAFAEAYASSRLAEVERTLECGHPQAGRILSSESALSPLICPACRLAEVTAQLEQVCGDVKAIQADYSNELRENATLRAELERLTESNENWQQKLHETIREADEEAVFLRTKLGIPADGALLKDQIVATVARLTGERDAAFEEAAQLLEEMRKFPVEPCSHDMEGDEGICDGCHFAWEKKQATVAAAIRAKKKHSTAETDTQGAQAQEKK
jgi:hypothetical protein